MNTAATSATLKAEFATTGRATLTGTCGRCDGTGNIRGFSHYANGVCFACAGTGILTVEASEPAPLTTRQIAIAAETAVRLAWIEAQADTDPRALAAKLARIAATDWKRVNELHNWSARGGVESHDTRGSRVCYWAASAALDAWPYGTAYPIDWIDGAEAERVTG